MLRNQANYGRASSKQKSPNAEYQRISLRDNDERRLPKLASCQNWHTIKIMLLGHMRLNLY
jgi:hypothetical protein